MHVRVIVLVYMSNLGRSLVLCALLYDNFVMPVKMERCTAAAEVKRLQERNIDPRETTWYYGTNCLYRVASLVLLIGSILILPPPCHTLYFKN